MAIRMKHFRKDDSGVASIEFALLGTLLILLFAGGFDIVYMINARRDADRASMLIAHAMATCSNSACISDLIGVYMPRQANALVRYPKASIKLYLIQEQSNVITSCSGSETAPLTDSKLLATAQNIMRDNDVGSAVMLTTTYTSILPKAVLGYISSTGASYSGRTVDVMKNAGALC